jgi:hypothetical protein
LKRTNVSKTGMPMTGAFYWSPIPRENSPWWVISSAHDFGLDSETGHVDLWPHVLTRLADAWGKDPVFLRRRLSLSYTGLPRGRVTKPEKVYLILHGNDAPIRGWEDSVIESFRLSRRKVRCLFDEHETQIPGHPEAFNRHFARIPRMNLVK